VNIVLNISLASRFYRVCTWGSVRVFQTTNAESHSKLPRYQRAMPRFSKTKVKRLIKRLNHLRSAPLYASGWGASMNWYYIYFCIIYILSVLNKLAWLPLNRRCHEMRPDSEYVGLDSISGWYWSCSNIEPEDGWSLAKTYAKWQPVKPQENPGIWSVASRCPRSAAWGLQALQLRQRHHLPWLGAGAPGRLLP